MPGVCLRPMTWEYFDSWSERSVHAFAAAQVEAGLFGDAEALEYAEQQFAGLLPDGIATAHHVLSTVHLGEGPALGHLWVRVRPLATEVEGYVFDVEILPGQRHQGLGRATMLAAESLARELGATVMRLNVFGHNVAALRLYDALGYAVVHAALTRACRERPTASDPAVELRDLTGFDLGEARAMLCSAPPPGVDRDLDLDGLLERPDSRHRVWAAEHDRSTVGMVLLRLPRRGAGRHAEVLAVHVRPGLRGQGYGRATQEAAERRCLQLGVTEVMVSVSGSDEEARQCYQRNGFELMAQTMAKELAGPEADS